MSQCVPSWDDVEEHQTTTTPKLTLGAHSNIAAAHDVPMVDYEVAELTWENGQLAMHGLGPPRVPNKPLPPSSSNSPSKYNTTGSAWEKPRASGTLESIVNQGSYLYHPTVNKPPFSAAPGGGDELLPWTTASATMTMDALVPCTNTTEDHCTARAPPLVRCSTRVGSCSGAPTRDQADKNGCRSVARRVPAVGTNSEWSGRADHSSASGSASSLFMRGNNNTNSNLVMTMDTGTDRDGPGRELTSTSLASPGNTSSDMPCTKATATTTADDHDSVCHSKTQREAEDEVQKKKGNGKSSVSTKRSRAAAIHNQSERKRRDKINQRMKTLQKLVPNSSKTDKASMLDEVIEYLKQLQAQVNMISRMNMPQMMLPMAMQQQLQMSLMNPMSMGMGLGMGMGLLDMNTIARPNLISPAVLHPSAFMPMAAWDGAADGRLSASGAVMPDPLSFIACQSQPMTMEAYSRMAAFYQQMSNQPPPPKD